MEIVDMTADEAVIELFFGEGGLEDPAPIYHHLRNIQPLHHSLTGAVFATRFDDCREVLRDNRFGKSNRSGPGLIPESDGEAQAFREEQRRVAKAEGRAQSMLFLNPPEHTRQRGLVARAFTPRRIEGMRADIVKLANRAVDNLADAGGGDVLEFVGFPFPVSVIGAMVGVPEADWPRFKTLVTTAAAGIEPNASVDELKAGGHATTEMSHYFFDLIGERRANPQDDMLSDLIVVSDGDDRLSVGEIIAATMLLFAAGFETTTNLIGNGTGALLRHPDQFDQLWNDQSLLPTAVGEMLRWDSPVQLDVRTALSDADVAGDQVAEGTNIVTLLGAANRDPAHFTEPDRFDVTRDEGPPMSFASGIHYCLGANLAKAEGEVVFAAMHKRFAKIELDGDLVRRNRFTLRGYQSVPVKVTNR